MESTRKRKRKRKETLFRPPRNVRKYLDRQIVTIAYSTVSGCQLLLQPWVPWAPKTDDKWPAQLIGNRAHFLITSQALEKKENKRKERGKIKHSMIIIADCCREIIWLSTHLKCEDASLGQQCIRSLKSYTGNGPVSSL